MGVIKQRLVAALDKLPRNGVLLSKPGDNAGSILGKIFIWQETKRYADAQLKGAWQAAVAADLIPGDDALREGEKIEKTFGESKYFTIVAEVSEPRKTFDRDTFIATVAKKYRIDPGKLNAIAVECTKETKAPLAKKVLEV